MYKNSSQFEPLLIGETSRHRDEVIGMAHDLVVDSARFGAGLPLQTCRSLSRLVSGMNCYYSNLIEGHHTRPVEIERAMRADYKDAGPRDMQTLALAHIEAESWARNHSLQSCGITPFILEVHRQFCSRLPVSMLTLKDGSTMAPGQIRDKNVSVGKHVAPDRAYIADFLNRYSTVYGGIIEKANKGGIHQLLAVAAAMIAHHRLVWVHPFSDGNGRVARIVLDAMLSECGLNPAGLWSMSRGFAKSSEEYKTRLADADQPRHGDLDGRGNLSESALVEFCRYAMKTASDQVKFMESMFSFGKFEDRCMHYFFKVRHDIKPESAYLYIHAFRYGEFERGEAIRLTGCAERTARDILARLINEGFLISDTPKGRVRAGFPVHALGTLFPNLYPAGDVDRYEEQASFVSKK